MASTDQDLRDRIAGRARNGRVGIRELDRGVILTMKPELITTSRTAGFGDNYFLTNIPNLSQPPDYPGVPIVFAIPEDVFEEFRIPLVMIRRSDFPPGLNRLHPGARQYRVPAVGASPVSVTNPVTGQVVQGYDRYATVAAPVPFDFSYELRILARNRAGRQRTSPRNQANAVMQYLMEIYKPYTAVFVEDTIGDVRSYHATATYSTDDELVDVTDRMIGYTINLEVEASLDLYDEVETRAATQFPSMELSFNG